MKRIRKITSAILSICFIFSLAACDNRTESPSDPSTAAPTQSLPEQKVLINTEGMTDLQKAVVITAESYYLRGKYAQYSQGKRTPGARAPEDYTEQSTGYTDCSAFVFDIYLFALGLDISNGSALTSSYCSNPFSPVLYEEPVKNNFSAMSPTDQALKLKEFTDTLEPGDVIVYRNADNTSGHAMLYVGNGMMIHSTGSDSGVEENGTVLYEPIANSLLSTGRRSLLTKSVYVILRPLLQFKGEIPAHTLQRMDLMRGIKAEKLSSLNGKQSVVPGTEITFTFRIANHSDREKTLTVTDTVPDNTVYISGGQTKDGDLLTWTVTVLPGETAEVSYIVQVDPKAPQASYIYTQSEISGIPVRCPVIMVLKG